MFLERLDGQTHEDWEEFLGASVDYIFENWKIYGTSKLEFFQKYEEKLILQLEEGGRFLYLLKGNSKIYGFLNAYLEDDCIMRQSIVFIAEFCIMNTYRNQGYGQKMLQMFTGLPELDMVESLAVEVDKQLLVPNIFWNKTIGNLNCAGLRNLYSRSLCSLRTDTKKR